MLKKGEFSGVEIEIMVSWKVRRKLKVRILDFKC